MAELQAGAASQYLPAHLQQGFRLLADIELLVFNLVEFDSFAQQEHADWVACSHDAKRRVSMETAMTPSMPTLGCAE